ncbi:hypothetical protein [Congregibacter sp.]
MPKRLLNVPDSAIAHHSGARINIMTDYHGRPGTHRAAALCGVKRSGGVL